MSKFTLCKERCYEAGRGEGGPVLPSFGTSPSLALSSQNFTRPRPGLIISVPPTPLPGTPPSPKQINRDGVSHPIPLRDLNGSEQAEFPRTPPCPTEQRHRREEGAPPKVRRQMGPVWPSARNSWRTIVYHFITACEHPRPGREGDPASKHWQDPPFLALRPPDARRE